MYTRNSSTQAQTINKQFISKSSIHVKYVNFRSHSRNNEKFHEKKKEKCYREENKSVYFIEF